MSIVILLHSRWFESQVHCIFGLWLGACYVVWYLTGIVLYIFYSTFKLFFTTNYSKKHLILQLSTHIQFYEIILLRATCRYFIYFLNFCLWPSKTILLPTNGLQPTLCKNSSFEQHFWSVSRYIFKFGIEKQTNNTII